MIQHLKQHQFFCKAYNEVSKDSAFPILGGLLLAAGRKTLQACVTLECQLWCPGSGSPRGRENVSGQGIMGLKRKRVNLHYVLGSNALFRAY